MHGATGRICSLRMIGGHFFFLRVKVQCMDLDSLIFTPHSFTIVRGRRDVLGC
jgi:hypothetical protein